MQVREDNVKFNFNLLYYRIISTDLKFHENVGSVAINFNAG